MLAVSAVFTFQFLMITRVHTLQLGQSNHEHLSLFSLLFSNALSYQNENVFKSIH